MGKNRVGYALVAFCCSVSVLLVLSFVLTRPARAGEGFAVGGGPGANRIGTAGVFITWPNSSLPIAYHVDGGTLGTLTNAQAVTLVDDLFGRWQAVPTSKIAYTDAGPIGTSIVASGG